MRKILPILFLLLLMAISTTTIFANVGESGPGASEVKTDPGAKPNFSSLSEMCAALRCEDDCDKFSANEKDGMRDLVTDWNRSDKCRKDGHCISWSVVGTIGHMCDQHDEPIDMEEVQEKFDEAGRSREPAFSGDCPCPGGVEVKKDGCSLTFICKMTDDFAHDDSSAHWGIRSRRNQIRRVETY